jgi:hypothetical protein
MCQFISNQTKAFYVFSIVFCTFLCTKKKLPEGVYFEKYLILQNFKISQ